MMVEFRKAVPNSGEISAPNMCGFVNLVAQSLPFGVMSASVSARSTYRWARQSADG
jgi:hypothetical protein